LYWVLRPDVVRPCRMAAGYAGSRHRPLSGPSPCGSCRSRRPSAPVGARGFRPLRGSPPRGPRNGRNASGQPPLGDRPRANASALPPCRPGREGHAALPARHRLAATASARRRPSGHWRRPTGPRIASAVLKGRAVSRPARPARLPAPSPRAASRRGPKRETGPSGPVVRRSSSVLEVIPESVRQVKKNPRVLLKFFPIPF
jgi:hypothetical protein